MGSSVSEDTIGREGGMALGTFIEWSILAFGKQFSMFRSALCRKCMDCLKRGGGDALFSYTQNGELIASEAYA